MDRYNRAWRDQKSPLTPLTPIPGGVFNFDKKPTPTTHFEKHSGSKRKDGSRELKRSLLAPSHHTSSNCSKASHFSQNFMRMRSVFSPNAQSTVVKEEIDRDLTPKPSGTQRGFKRGSPVEQPSLSPRVRSLLSRTGNQHMAEVFTRQEIDFQVLIQMTLDELESLGVRGAKELKLAIDIIKLAKNFFK